MGALEPETLQSRYAFDRESPFVPRRRDTVAIPLIWVALLASVLMHATVLFFLPSLRFAPTPAGDPDRPLSVELRPRPQMPQGALELPAAPAKPQPAPAVPAPRASAPPHKVAPRPAPPPAPPVIARAQPAQPAPPPQPESSTPAQARAPDAGDFAAYVEARRRSRGASAPVPAQANAPSAPPLEDDAARSKRVVAANLGLDRTPTFGEHRPSGGIFQVTRLNYNDAEFLFFGWNKDIRRNTTQLIEVRKAGHADIRLAVVRRMIAIVREYESGDFRWESQRLGRDVILSARLVDNAGLEDFLMREFFETPRPSLIE